MCKCTAYISLHSHKKYKEHLLRNMKRKKKKKADYFTAILSHTPRWTELNWNESESECIGEKGQKEESERENFTGNEKRKNM